LPGPKKHQEKTRDRKSPFGRKSAGRLNISGRERTKRLGTKENASWAPSLSSRTILPQGGTTCPGLEEITRKKNK